MSSELRLDTAEGFFAALRSPDIVLRLSVLQAIGQSPELALQFGKQHGNDVVDELIHQAYQKQGITYMSALVGTLANFDDSRVVAFFKKLLVMWDRPEVLGAAVQRLSREPLETIEEIAFVLLKQDQSIPHIRAAADLLLTSPRTSDAQKVRISLANNQLEDLGIPCDNQTVDAWLDELHRPFAPDARVLLERRGEAAFEALLLRWSGMTPDDRIWMLNWARTLPVAAMGALRLGLEDPHRDVQLAALEAVAAIEGASAILREPVTRFGTSDDRDLRLAAIRAGAPTDLSQVLETASPEELIRLVGNLRSVSEAASFLEHADWRVRAASAQALVALGEAAIPVCRRLVSHERMEVRVGATSVLFQLGDVEWLEENLLLDSNRGEH